MKVTPVRESPPPAYPQRDALLRERKMLEECVPHGWRRLGGMAAMLLAAGFSGCGGAPTGVTTASPPEPPESIVRDAGFWTCSLLSDPMPLGGSIAIIIDPSEDEVGARLEDDSGSVEAPVTD